MASVGFFTAVDYGSEASGMQCLLEKIDSYFNFDDRVARVMQGKVKNGQEQAVLITTDSSLLMKIAKVVSYIITLFIVPAILLLLKVILRSIHSFRLIDPQHKLEKGIDLEEIRPKIERLMPQILAVQKDSEEIEWLSIGDSYLVFKLKEHPELVFKIPQANTQAESNANSRFDNMIKAKTICLIHQLGLLVIPHAKKFMVGDRTLIVEEALSFNPTDSAQEYLYDVYASQLTETIRQYAKMVEELKPNDVIWRNAPVLEEPQDFNGDRRLGLIDLEHTKRDAYYGFVGDCNGSCGLIGCVFEQQLDLVIQVASKHYPPRPLQQRREQREEEIRQYRELLNTFYPQRGVERGDELIPIDEDSLDFSAYDPKIAGELKSLATAVLEEINKQIADSSPQKSIKGRRIIHLNGHNSPFFGVQEKRVDESIGIGFHVDDQEYYNNTYMICVINKLQELGLVFRCTWHNGMDYYVQA